GWTRTTILAAGHSLVRTSLRASSAAWHATGELAKVPWFPRSRARPEHTTRSSFSTWVARRRVSAAVPPTPRRRAPGTAPPPRPWPRSSATTRSGFVASGHLPGGGAAAADDDDAAGCAVVASGAPASAGGAGEAAGGLVVTGAAEEVAVPLPEAVVPP